jgi:hypothetical protein
VNGSTEEAIVALFCPKSIKGCALRITRLNECGVPLDPLVPNSRIQTAAFTEITLSPDTEDGEDITIKNACGAICIRDKDCMRLKGFDVEMKLCGIPLMVLEMILDSTLLEAPTPGDFKGAVLRESKSAPCAYPKMIEVWSKNANRDQCGVGGLGANVFVHWLLPHTTNWEISGDLTFNQGALEVTLAGYAENNPNWFPSWPGPTFPSYVPGGGDPTGVPTGPPGPVLPSGITADTWTLSDQAAIQAGGPLAWQNAATLPSPIDDCGYVGASPGS